MREGHEFYCHEDPDGRCQECIGRMMKPFTEIVVVFNEFQEKVGKVVGGLGSICNTCAKANADFGIARVFKEILVELPPPLRQSLGKTLFDYAVKTLGVPAMPLTEKAIKDAAETL